ALPFMFIFNTQLLLLDITSFSELMITVVSAIVANLVFVAATQGWFMTRNKWWETILLLLLAFSLFRPGYWMDRIAPPYEQVPVAQLASVIEHVEPQGRLRLWTEGENLFGKRISKGVLVPLGDA